MRTVLVIVAVILALGCAASSASAATSFVSFQSPSHNIGCYLAPGQARCDVLKREWTIPKPRGCPSDLDFGFGATLTSRGRGRAVCAGDTALSSGSILRYGKSISRFGFKCTSSTAGMRCRNRAGHGFFLSRQRYQLY